MMKMTITNNYISRRHRCCRGSQAKAQAQRNEKICWAIVSSSVVPIIHHRSWRRKQSGHIDQPAEQRSSHTLFFTIMNMMMMMKIVAPAEEETCSGIGWLDAGCHKLFPLRMPCQRWRVVWSRVEGKFFENILPVKEEKGGRRRRREEEGSGCHEVEVEGGGGGGERATMMTETASPFRLRLHLGPPVTELTAFIVLVVIRFLPRPSTCLPACLSRRGRLLLRGTQDAPLTNSNNASRNLQHL